MQVDVITMPTTTVTATDLDIRNLVAATDSVSIHGDVGIINQLDLANTKWGINEWNATVGGFTLKNPIIVTDPAQADQYGTPNSSIGTIGSYAVNVNLSTNAIFYKNSNNNWVRVCDTEWQNSWATVTGTNTLTSTTAFPAGASVTINGTLVNFNTARSLNGIVSAINAANITGILAANVNNQLTFYVDSTATNGTIVLVESDSVNTPLAIAGVTPGTYYAPQIAFASYVDVPSCLSSDAAPAPTGSVYIKTSTQGNGLSLSVKKYNANSRD